jgi:hypothetical protein
MKMENALINYFDDDNAILDLSGYPSYNRPSHRIELRKQEKLLYALMDFNISIMVPRNIRKEDYQRPYRDSFDGSGYHPYDTAQGEYDYNPFAFDVGTLGVVFCEHYQVRVIYCIGFYFGSLTLTALHTTHPYAGTPSRQNDHERHRQSLHSS